MTAKKPYHKENLRRDLLEAGREYVKAHGHHDLSVRKLAQQVGVSPGAPYHHFPDRRSLLLALAIDGFDSLAIASGQFDIGGTVALERVKALAANFVKFALENPHLIELMYESELTRPSLDPALLKFQLDSQFRGTQIIKESVPGITDKEAGLRNLALWTSIYGLVSMINKGVLRPFGDGDFEIPEICDWVIERAAASALAA